MGIVFKGGFYARSVLIELCTNRVREYLLNNSGLIVTRASFVADSIVSHHFGRVRAGTIKVAGSIPVSETFSS